MVSDDCVPRLELRFEAFIEDGLGLQFAALVETKSGVFAIRRGVDQPRDGHVVTGVECAVDPSDQLLGFLSEFGLVLNDVTWTSPEIALPAD